MLTLLRKPCVIIEHDQRAGSLRGIHTSEARCESGVRNACGDAFCRQCRIVPPAPDLFGQRRRQLTQCLPFGDVEVEQIECLIISEPHHAVWIQYQDAGLQLANDILIELLEVGEIDTALCGQRLAVTQANRQYVRQRGGGEQHQAHESGAGHGARVGLFEFQ